MSAALPIVFVICLLAFVGVLVPLVGVRHTCAGACERLEQLGCEGCPRRARTERGR